MLLSTQLKRLSGLLCAGFFFIVESAWLLQQLWHCEVETWQIMELCKAVELACEGSVTNGATLSLFN